MNKEKNKDKKKKFLWKVYYIGCVFIIITSLVVRYLITGEFIAESLIAIGFRIIRIFLALFLQIIIHEAGHLVFGLLSGYRFSSFTIASFTWVKEGKKIHFKRLSVAGILGQCLMIPPDMVNGKMPFVLCNLGGSFMNIIFSLVFLGVAMLFRDIHFLYVFFILASFIGFACALINAVPIKWSTVNNDGYNTLAIGKSSSALRAFWVQLKVAEQMSNGVRLKDMPEEWFSVPSNNEMKNSVTTTLGVLATNRMMDMHNFDGAKGLINKFLAMDFAFMGLHYKLMVCDRVYYELIGGYCQNKLDEMLDKRQKNFMKQMKRFPPVIRTEYAYALIAEKDLQKAEQINAQFEKVAITYPYQGDIESEREMIQIAKQKFVDCSLTDDTK